MLHLASKGGVKPTLPLKPPASPPKAAPAPAPALPAVPQAVNPPALPRPSNNAAAELIILDDDDEICEVVNYQPRSSNANAAARREKRKANEVASGTGDPDIEGSFENKQK